MAIPLFYKLFKLFSVSIPKNNIAIPKLIMAAAIFLLLSNLFSSFKIKKEPMHDSMPETNIGMPNKTVKLLSYTFNNTIKDENVCNVIITILVKYGFSELLMLMFMSKILGVIKHYIALIFTFKPSIIPKILFTVSFK